MSGTWIIIMLIVGLILIIAYRIYFSPSLSKQGKLQRERYLQWFRFGRTLVFQMSLDQMLMLRLELKKLFRCASSNKFYGTNTMIHLQTNLSEVSLRIFCPTEDLLSKNLWILMQIKRKIEEVLPYSAYE